MDRRCSHFLACLNLLLQNCSFDCLSNRGAVKKRIRCLVLRGRRFESYEADTLIQAIIYSVFPLYCTKRALFIELYTGGHVLEPAYGLRCPWGRLSVKHRP